MNDKRETLGDNVKPSNYNLEFEPDLKTFKYKGHEVISVSIKKSTKTITLNVTSLTIKSALVIKDAKKQTATTKLDVELQRLTLTFDEEISGDVQIEMTFEGTNDDSMRGIYRSKYTFEGKDHYILTSQFEAADARKGFPCFDEPEFKATFDVSFIIEKDLTGISNMTIKKEEPMKNGKKKVTFNTTPKMSSYLLYVGIGKYEFNTAKYKNIEFRVVAVPGKGQSTKLALGYGLKGLKYFDEYFGVDFPLPKMDLLAIPDFAAGAMENWGAITFRETDLLGDEKLSAVAIKQRIAEVICHELAHQWFGDLVTMKWWDDLWLNESFATFMATKAVDAIFPEWEFGLQDRIAIMGTALAADQFTTTHPINTQVNNPKEINEIFDAISYDKGGAVLAMLEDYAGKELFRKGLHNYLKKHAYSNATKYDLWNAIEETIKKEGDKNSNFSKVATDWVDKTGYPVIDVTSSNSDITLNQKRYLLFDKDGSKSKETWTIPVHYLDDKKDGSFILLTGKSANLKTGKNVQVKLNYGQKGLYRVNYEVKMLDRLGLMIKEKKLPYVDGWGIETDVYALSRSARVKVSVYLDFVEKYCMDCDYPLNANVSGHISGLETLLCDEKNIIGRITKLNIAYHEKALAKIGWTESENERNVTTLYRSGIILTLGMENYKPVMDKVKKYFDEYLKGTPVPKNIRSAIYRAMAWNGDEELFKKFVELYNKEQVPDEKRRLLIALSSFGNAKIIEKALAFSLTKDVRLQDSYVAPIVASSNEVGKKLIWPWLKGHWKDFLTKYDPGTHMLPAFVETLGIIDNEKEKKEIEVFFSKKENMRGDIRQAYGQSIELIEANIRLKELNKK